MRTDLRSVLSGRPQAHAPHNAVSRAVARRRAVGAIGALALLFALTTTGAWAEEPVDVAAVESPSTATPIESPSPSPEPTETPSPTSSPTDSPSEHTPPAGEPDGEESDEESDEDESDDEESDDEESDEEESDEEDESDDENPTGPEPRADTPESLVLQPVTGSFVQIDAQTGELEFGRYVPAAIAAAEEEAGPLDAEFDFGVTPGSLTVEFEDKSSCSWEGEDQCDIDYWSWNFGDGETFETSSEQEKDPEPHTYATSGTYDVSLTVKYVYFSNVDRVANFSSVDQVAAVEDPSPSCGPHYIEGDYYDYFVFCDTETKSVTVSEGPEASFTAIPSSGPAPLTVQFTDTSTGTIDSRSWNFNGPACGAASAGPTERQFTEVFTTVGDCVVTLQVNAPPIPDPGPSFGLDVAAFEPNCNCSIATKTITVTNKPPVIPQNDDDDSDDNDDSDEDSDDSDDDGDPGPGVFLPNRPPLTGQPTPEPTDPSPTPTSKPITPINPTPPTPPTEPVDPESAAWVTGTGASAAGLALMILAAVIGSMRGLSMAGQRVALVADRDENTIQRHVASRDAEGWGDRSFTWRFPGHRLIDAASVVLPDRLFRFSPLVGRIAEDGSEFRAMFGTLWLATPLAGIALGLASAAAAGGRALPPSVWLVAAGAVLATFDAFAGAIAIVLFAGAALLGGLGGIEGGPDTVHSLLVILAIGFLWMAIPLIGSAIRPFRRLGDGSVRHRWDVVGDGLIAALLCGWVAQKLTQAMDLFAGQKTGLPEHANTVAIVVMAAVALRVSMEHFAVTAYPQRLQQVEGEDPPSPFLASVVLGAFIRTAVFGFIGYAFIGSCWQLWLGIGLFLIPQLIDHLRERFRNIGVVQRILPRGVVEIFILVVTCTLIARYAMNQTPDEFTGLRLAFLLIAIPPALLGALRVFAEDADESGDSSWARQFLGAIIVAVTAVLAARGWDY